MDTGIRTFFCGPESFTPDLRPIVGEAPEVRNYFVAAGLNSIGILTGGGLGRLVAHWIITGHPDMDVTGMDPARLQPYQANPEYRRTRTVESLGMVYQCHYPNKALTTARDAKRSPLHAQLAAQGAYFKDVSGWEGADWYAGPGNTPDAGPLTWGRPAFWRQWEEEHRACREGVIVMDMSFMSKFRVQGRDAGRVLQHVSANDVDGGAGTITYTQWLDELGKLQADLTITKLADDDFFVVATDTAHRHVEAHLGRHVGDAHAFVTDVTGAHAQINVQGPRSRELLQDAHHRRHVERGVPVPRGARPSTSASPGCSACASPTSASWATSSTCPRSRPCTCTTGSWTPAERSGCATPASRRSPACAWRRATATTATTSTTPTTR